MPGQPSVEGPLLAMVGADLGNLLAKVDADMTGLLAPRSEGAAEVVCICS